MKALEVLGAGGTVKAAAQAAGVVRETVHRWLRDDPEFIAARNAARMDLAEAVRGELRGLARDAVRTVRKVMLSANASAAVRLKAALAVLETVDGLATEAIGPTDAEMIRSERAKAERDWQRWGRLLDDAMPTPLIVPNWTTDEDRGVSPS